jgi:hypothetical protein
MGPRGGPGTYLPSQTGPIGAPIDLAGRSLDITPSVAATFGYTRSFDLAVRRMSGRLLPTSRTSCRSPRLPRYQRRFLTASR